MNKYELTEELLEEQIPETKDTMFSRQALALMQKAFPGKSTTRSGPKFIMAQVRTSEGGTWLTLQVGEGYDWSRAELKTSHRQLGTQLEKLVKAQIEVFKMSLGGRL